MRVGCSRQFGRREEGSGRVSTGTWLRNSSVRNSSVVRCGVRCSVGCSVGCSGGLANTTSTTHTTVTTNVHAIATVVSTVTAV
mgnify:CR=1 FL=1